MLKLMLNVLTILGFLISVQGLRLPRISTKNTAYCGIKPLHSGHIVKQLPVVHKISNTAIFGAAMSSFERCEIYAESMKGPRWGGFIGPLVRYLNICVVATFFTIILRIMNHFKSFGKEKLMKHIWKREEGRGLLTVSNHMSVMDDPGLWSALLPWWRIRPEKMRWGVCTDDVFFCFNGKMSPLFGGGNVIPLDRSGSLEQPLFKRFHEKLNQGSWCHIFAEGRVWQSWRFDPDLQHLGKFKFGVGKLVAHSNKSPIVIPIYHKGMDEIVPEKPLTGKARAKRASFPLTIVPKMGKNIEMHIGEPLDFSQELKDFHTKHPGVLDNWNSTAETLDLYMSITARIREAVTELEKQAWTKGEKLAALKRAGIEPGV